MPPPNWKIKPIRNKAYVKWISSQPCCITDAPPPSDPHHSKLPGNAGMGTKVGDDRCLPLARWLHMEVEAGESAFWAFWGRDNEELIRFYNEEWRRMGNSLPGRP